MVHSHAWHGDVEIMMSRKVTECLSFNQCFNYRYSGRSAAVDLRLWDIEGHERRTQQQTHQPQQSYRARNLLDDVAFFANKTAVTYEQLEI